MVSLLLSLVGGKGSTNNGHQQQQHAFDVSTAVTRVQHAVEGCRVVVEQGQAEAFSQRRQRGEMFANLVVTRYPYQDTFQRRENQVHLVKWR